MSPPLENYSEQYHKLVGLVIILMLLTISLCILFLTFLVSIGTELNLIITTKVILNSIYFVLSLISILITYFITIIQST